MKNIVDELESRARVAREEIKKIPAYRRYTSCFIFFAATSLLILSLSFIERLTIAVPLGLIALILVPLGDAVGGMSKWSDRDSFIDALLSHILKKSKSIDDHESDKHK